MTSPLTIDLEVNIVTVLLTSSIDVIRAHAQNSHGNRNIIQSKVEVIRIFFPPVSVAFIFHHWRECICSRPVSFCIMLEPSA